MKTIIKITVFLVLSIMCLKSSAQSCFVGTITLNSQSDINNFQANYGPCDSIVPGSKLIIDDLAGDIVDSSPLSDLTFVNWLQVYNTDLTNIDGFENLSQSTMSKCIFVDNPLLEDISALSGIVNGSDWSFTNSPALTDLTGIDQITGYGTSLTLSNLGITDLDDLSNLTLIARFFTLSNNANLTDISGLSNLTDFGAGQNGGFFIKDNPNLADCSAICSLVKNLLPTRPTNTVDIQGNIAQCIDEATVISSCATTPCNYGFTNLGLGSQAAVNNFQITYGPCDSLSAILVIADSNNNITDLSTLSTLRYSNGIIVDGNNNLTDLSGLENLEVLNLGTFRISDNPILTDISQLSNVGPFSGRIEFRNNPSLTDLSTAQNFTGASRLIVDDMDGLTDLDDFSNIDRILTEYRISNNANLTDISGASGFEFGYALPNKIFEIDNNSSLSDCSPICNIVKIRMPELEGTITTNIQANLGDCLDEAAILANCGRTACNQNSVLLETNGAVSSFQQVYGPCDSIVTNLTIDNSALNNILGLGSLSALEYIGNNLTIQDCIELTSLDGLQNISQPDFNTILIANNPKLRDVSQLSGIGPDVNNLSFVNNTVLSDFSGVETIETLQRLTLQLNGNMYNLDAFSNLTDITTQITIKSNDKLNNINGLSGITYGSGANLIFSLDQNQMLFDCTPLCGVINTFPSLSFNTKEIDDNLGDCFDEVSLTSACCTHPDYDALVAFYNAMDGDNWTDNTGWLEDCDPCGLITVNGWNGIICDGSNRVTSIDMSQGASPNNLLSGTLPSEIFSMPFLTTLDLGEADLIGNFPEEFCSSTITHFAVSNCSQLTGVLPSCLPDMTNLVQFNIINGSITGPLPNFDGDNNLLAEVRLSNNNITGPIPAKWGNLPSLTGLSLIGNQLSGSYDTDLLFLCPAGFTNNMVSDGNSFAAPWEDFCGFNAGVSPCGSGSTEIPDSNFEQALIDLNIDSDGAQNGCVLNSDIANLTELNISNREINDLTGINAFTSLITLIADENDLVLADYNLKSNLEIVYIKGGN